MAFPEVVVTLAPLGPQESVPLVLLVKKEMQAFLETQGPQAFQVRLRDLKGKLQGHRYWLGVRDAGCTLVHFFPDSSVFKSSSVFRPSFFLVSDGPVHAQKPQIS